MRKVRISAGCRVRCGAVAMSSTLEREGHKAAEGDRSVEYKAAESDRSVENLA